MKTSHAIPVVEKILKNLPSFILAIFTDANSHKLASRVLENPTRIGKSSKENGDITTIILNSKSVMLFSIEILCTVCA
jgi:hypothetical protein